MIARVARAMRGLTAAPSVPVLVYHSVGQDNEHPLWGPLTLPVEVFAAQLEWLQREGYHTITLYQLHAYLAHGTPLPERPILLTFDDGFLDNWVYVCPLLEHYGFQATLFLCPAFVQTEAGVRPRAEVERQTPDALHWWGYLRWDEVRAMIASGAFDVQGHALTHHRYFAGPQVMDYLHPDAPYYWCRWNAAPERQPYWLEGPAVMPGQYGEPVYEHAEALLAPRYDPDAELAALTRSLVATGGGAVFFAQPGWRDVLDAAVRDYRTTHGERGHVEPRDAYVRRVRHELDESRRILERELHTDIDFLCWPVDKSNDEVHALALESGYTATTCLQRPNRPGADPTRIGRSYWGQSDEAYRIRRPWLMYLKFRGFVRHMDGSHLGYLQMFLANRLIGWHDRSHQRAHQ